MKSQKGITLVALVVTIIVLVILAGIVIFALMGDNSVLRQANSARVTNIEGSVNEEVKLACGALRIAVAEAQAKDNSYNVLANVKAVSDTLENVLNEDTNLEEEYTVTDEADENKILTVTYAGNDYKQATNDSDATITFKVQLAQSTVELVKGSMSTNGLKVQEGGKNIITINEITNK